MTESTTQSANVNHALRAFQAEMLDMHARAREGVARMASQVNNAIQIIGELQNSISRAEAALGLKLHCLAEGLDSYVTTLYSQSVMYAVAEDFSRSRNALGAISDVVRYANLATAAAIHRIKKDQRGGNRVREDAPVLSGTNRVENVLRNEKRPTKQLQSDPRYATFLKNESWFNTSGFEVDKSAVSVKVEFATDEDSRRNALEEVQRLLKSDGSLSTAPIETPVSLAIPPADLLHFVFVDQKIHELISRLDTKSIQALWHNFYHALQTPPGQFAYDCFRPPWCTTRTQFVTGGKELKTLSSGAKTMPPLTLLRYSNGRGIADCVLTGWMSYEPRTRGLLRQMLSEFGLMTELPAFPDLPEVDHFTHAALLTLLPGHLPCDNVLNSFLTLLTNERDRILPVGFCYNLCNRSHAEIKAWCSQSDLESAVVRRVLMPLKNSKLGLFALAVIDRNAKTIDVIDCRSERRTFVPLYPGILRFVLSLGPSWPGPFEFKENRDAQCNLSSITDCGILMCYHAFIVTKRPHCSFLPVIAPPTLREAVMKCILEMKLGALELHFTDTSSPQLASIPPPINDSPDLFNLPSPARVDDRELHDDNPSIVLPKSRANSQEGQNLSSNLSATPPATTAPQVPPAANLTVTESVPEMTSTPSQTTTPQPNSLMKKQTAEDKTLPAVDTLRTELSKSSQLPATGNSPSRSRVDDANLNDVHQKPPAPKKNAVDQPQSAENSAAANSVARSAEVRRNIAPPQNAAATPIGADTQANAAAGDDMNIAVEDTATTQDEPEMEPSSFYPSSTPSVKRTESKNRIDFVANAIQRARNRKANALRKNSNAAKAVARRAALRLGGASRSTEKNETRRKSASAKPTSSKSKIVPQKAAQPNRKEKETPSSVKDSRPVRTINKPRTQAIQRRTTRSNTVSVTTRSGKSVRFR